jgi:hypothetical protein
MAQMVEHLSSQHEAMTSTPSTEKKKKEQSAICVFSALEVLNELDWDAG